MPNRYPKAHRQQGSRNQSDERGYIDVAEHPMAERYVAAFPRVGNSACQAHRQSDDGRRTDRELRLHAGSFEIGREQRSASNPRERSDAAESQAEYIQCEITPRHDLQRGPFRDIGHHQRRREELEAGYKSEQRNWRRFGGNGAAEYDTDDYPRCGTADHSGAGAASAVVAIGALG